MEEESFEIHEKILTINNEILQKTQNIDKKFVLIKSKQEISKTFKSTYIFVDNFLEFLTNEPYIMYQLLSFSNHENIKILSSFFINKFSENIYSSNILGDNIMYVIALLLKDEIEKMENEETDNFLNNSTAAIMIGELCNKIQIKSFCRNSIQNFVQELENNSKRLYFDLDKIKQGIYYLYKNSNIKLEESTIFKANTFNNTEEINRRTISNFVDDYSYEKDLIQQKSKETESESYQFMTKYMPDLSLKLLNEKLEEFQKANDKKMEEYMMHQINILKKENKGDKIYCNEKLIDNIYDSEYSQQIFTIYLISFLKTIKAINLLFKNLITNLSLLPYQIKCLCKIILILLKKRFPNINKIQQNAFISKFFFDKILIPILINPCYGAYINEYIISDETIDNLKIISKIILQLCLGKFFTQDIQKGYYTPFNLYFLEIMPDVFIFFDEISNVNLPEFLDKFVNGGLGDDYNISYFDLHPDDVFAYKSILFSLEDFYLILKTMIEFKDKITFTEKSKSFQSVFNKISNVHNMKIIEEICAETIAEQKRQDSQASLNSQNSQNSQNNSGKMKPKKKGKNKDSQKDKDVEVEKDIEKLKIKKYILINKLSINEKFKNNFYAIKDNPFFSQNELKGENQEQNNLIIKIKNSICAVLYNSSLLNENLFKPDIITNSLSIIKELKNFVPEKTSLSIIPIHWYINSIMDYISSLPSNLTTNNYYPLFKEIENDINGSLCSLNFDILSTFVDKTKNIKVIENLHLDEEKRLKDIILNKKIQIIIEKDQFPCEIYFNFTINEKKLSIKELNNQKNILNYFDSSDSKQCSKNQIYCKTIKSFTKCFPNLSKNGVLTKNKNKYFDILREINLENSIFTYMGIIKNNLFKSKYANEEEHEIIISKIFDFINEKLYDKIFPSFISDEDTTIYNNCLKLSWTEYKHFSNYKINQINTVLPDIIYNFQQFEQKHSPKIKIEYLNNIFQFIDKIQLFNGKKGEDIGIDEQMSVLSYAFVKARPKNFATNYYYIELFNRKNGEDESIITRIKIIFQYIKNIGYNLLNNITKEEYNLKCKESIKNINKEN